MRSKEVSNHGQKRIRKNAWRYATNASFTSKSKTGAENADAISVGKPSSGRGIAQKESGEEKAKTNSFWAHGWAY
jgi:hypothetical protein